MRMPSPPERRIRHDLAQVLPLATLICLLLAAAAITCGGSAVAGDGTAEHGRPLYRVGVDTVFVDVTVTDRHDRCIRGLEQSAFRVFDDNVEQEVTLFSAGQAPISVGIIFDRSGSMASDDNILAAKRAVERFLKPARADDEFFLVSFNQQAQVASDFTHDAEEIVNELARQQPYGKTALYDAIYLAMEKMKSASNERRALLLISDGEDNSSRYSAGAVKEFARESDVQFYAIGEQGQFDFGRIRLEELAEITGGRAFFADSFNDLEHYIDAIQDELRGKYVIGYRPSIGKDDSKWHKIQVKMERPEGFPRMYVRARKGYYASR